MNEFIFLEKGLEPTRLWGGVPLFNLIDGHKLLVFCDEHDVAVLGIEGFKVVGDKRVPDMDCIADFSALTITARELFPVESRKLAKCFLSSISDPDMLLEFVLVKS
ncbi:MULTISPECIES: hypothetical protein [Pseudomonas]|uniref:hypothetical protein n=1 Tax=Pseudomonas TaxID=286 RepID=UPI0005ACBAD8|nr:MULTISPECIES: hypothetical protein [Pseudomonas]